MNAVNNINNHYMNRQTAEQFIKEKSNKEKTNDFDLILQQEIKKLQKNENQSYQLWSSK